MISAIILRVSDLVLADDNPAVRAFETGNSTMCKEDPERRLGHSTGRPFFEFDKNEFSFSHYVNPCMKSSGRLVTYKLSYEKFALPVNIKVFLINNVCSQVPTLSSCLTMGFSDWLARFSLHWIQESLKCLFVAE